MVALDCLECLDGLLWLRTGRNVARYFGYSQSTVSRNAGRVLRFFELKGERVGGDWKIDGDCSLLDLERRVHQRYRWEQGRSLRLDGQILSAAPLATTAPDGWILGPCSEAAIKRPLRLLRAGVIDGWLGPWPDVPNDDDPELAVIRLTRVPLVLAVGPSHPLLAPGASIGLADLPLERLQPLAPGAFPCLLRELAALGLHWPISGALADGLQPGPEGPAAAGDGAGAAVMLATPLSLGRLSPPWLELCLPGAALPQLGDALVVRREFRDHSRLAGLLEEFAARLEPLFAERPELHPDGGRPLA